MRDRDLCAKLLGIEEPWCVRDVDPRIELGEVEIFISLDERAEVACPVCGATKLEEAAYEADYERRLAPVKQSVEACWLMEGKENDYRRELVQQLLRTLNVVAKPDAPLPTGTKVDAHMEFGDEDWYITIKRGLNNQKRLVLQGEIEDIILHAPRRDRDLWIYMVIGMTDPEDPQALSHLHQLCAYASHRSVFNYRGHHTGEDEPRVNIEVMIAVIPSSPIEVGVGTGELVPA